MIDNSNEFHTFIMVFCKNEWRWYIIKLKNYENVGIKVQFQYSHGNIHLEKGWNKNNNIILSPVNEEGIWEMK